MNTQHIMELAEMYAHAKVTDDCPPEKLPRNLLKAAVEDMEATHLRELAAYRLTVENLEREIAAQQPAPSPAPAKWLEQAFREGWAACRDSEFVGEEAEEWSFGSSQANGRMIDIQQAAPTAQADTQPALAPDEREAFEAWALSERLGAPTEQMGFRFHDAGNMHPAWKAWQARAARAPADSVQEDAARLDWLDQQCEGYGFQDIHEGNRWEISGPYANVRQAIDYERAARKQGEKQ